MTVATRVLGIVVRLLVLLRPAAATPKGPRELLPKWPAGASLPKDPNASVTATSPGPVVHITNGLVRGVVRGIEKKSIAWWGIPFAEPPVGDLRLRAPQPYRRTWQKTFDASIVPPSCAEVEDCLYLNVYTSATALVNASTPRPVMVWIYGGGFVDGNSFQWGLYDAQHLAEQHDVVLVAANYRLGNLGFMALDALKQEDPDSSTGNYGVQDQTLALKWVRENIASFGGDPGRVTLFGESAGGISVMWHLVSLPSQGLFHAAIVQSGVTAITYFFQPYADASAYHEETATILNCSATMGAAAQLKCLRSLSMEAIRDGARHTAHQPEHYSPLYPIMPVGPVIDGTQVGLLDVPLRLVQMGKFNKVPLMIGANEDGGSVFEPDIRRIVPQAKWPATQHPETVAKVMGWIFHENQSAVEAIYKREEYKAAEFPEDKLLARLLRDVVFMCPIRTLVTAWFQQHLPAYMYVFRFRYGLVIDKVIHLGDFHGGELPFVFKNWLWAVKALAPSTDPNLMSDIMSCKWTSFAYTHSPNGGPEESKWPPGCTDINRRYSDWPSYNPADRAFYALQDDPQVHEILSDNVFPDDVFPRDQKCDLLDKLEEHLRWEDSRVVQVFI